MFLKLIPKETLKVCFQENSSSIPSRKVKILHNKLGNTNTRSKHLASSERLQNTIFKVSSTTEKANGDLLFTKPAATDFGRNSEKFEKDAVHKIAQKNSNLGFLSDLFLEGKKDEGNRPVINVKDLNSFIPYEQFKMEGLHSLKLSLKKGIFSER